MTASQLIRRARLDAGLTQAQMADRLGTTQTAVARLEHHGSNPRISTIERALRAAGHRLRLEAVPTAGELDETQIAVQLRMTPAERARAHDAAYRNARDLVRQAQRVR